MLSNAYFLAKFRFDTDENEPAKNLLNFANFPNFASPQPAAHRRPGDDDLRVPEGGPVERAVAVRGERARGVPARLPERRHVDLAARVGLCFLRSEVNNSLIIVNFFHKIQNFRQISDLFSQI